MTACNDGAAEVGSCSDDHGDENCYCEGAPASKSNGVCPEAPDADQIDRLGYQHHIDYDAPFFETQWSGTHNSYNAAMDGYPYPNHFLGITEQLETGFRLLNIDLYGSGGAAMMCHAICGASDRQLEEGLLDIKNWLALVFVVM